jgi:hypothetical protein
MKGEFSRTRAVGVGGRSEPSRRDAERAHSDPNCPLRRVELSASECQKRRDEATAELTRFERTRRDGGDDWRALVFGLLDQPATLHYVSARPPATRTLSRRRRAIRDADDSAVEQWDEIDRRRG